MTSPSQPPTTAQGVTPAERDKLAELIFLVNTARMSPDEIGDPAEPNEQEYELADALLEAGYSRAPSSAPPTQEPVAWAIRDDVTGKLVKPRIERYHGERAVPLYLAAPPAPARAHPDDAAIISRVRRMVETNEHSFSAFESVAILRVCELAALPSRSTEQSHDAVESLAQLLVEGVPASSTSLPASAEQPT